MSGRLALLLLAIVSFVLAAVASEEGREIVWQALTWVAVGLAFLAASLIS